MPNQEEFTFRPTNSFWTVFAVFFPATTGIMAGANRSGDLADPKRSIPPGTLAAVGVSFVIYVLLAVWLARSATPEETTNNYYAMMNKAQDFLEKLSDLGRFPNSSAVVGPRLVDQTNSTCMFVRDSGPESALA